MVFKKRPIYLKTGAVFSIAAFFAGAFLAPKMQPVFQALFPHAVRRGGFAVRAFWGGEASAFVPNIAALAALFFAAFFLCGVIYFFEHTESPEIRCFEIFAISFTFEMLRFSLPLKNLYAASPFYLLAAERLLLFFRFSALAALFAAGLFAAGIKLKKQITLLLPFCLAALLVAIQIPVDIYSFDTRFSPLLGFAGLLEAIEIIIALITGASFFAGALGRGLPEYRVCGAGAILLSLGKSALQKADTLALLILALLFLLTGFYLYLSGLRKIYIWR